MNSVQKSQANTRENNDEEEVLLFEVKIGVNSKEYARLQRIQKVTYIDDIPQLLLGCVNIAYNHYFRLVWGGLLAAQDAPQKELLEK